MKKKQINLTPWFISALLFGGMGFMLLFVLVVFERSAFGLLFSQGSDVPYADVLNVISALKLVVDVLPYMLGPFIVGTFVSGIMVARKSNWHWRPTGALILFTLPVFYNIFLADTAIVVETLKSVAVNQPPDVILSATQAVMQQHHIGMIGFASFLICYVVLTLRIFAIPNSSYATVDSGERRLTLQ